MPTPKSKKPPVIRPRDSVPFRRCTLKDKEERIEIVAQLLSQLKSKWQIHKHCSPAFGITSSQIDRIYIPHAKKLLAKRANTTPGKVRELSSNVLHEVIRTGTNKEKIRAVEVLNSIHGTLQPRSIVHVNNTVEVTTDSRPLKDAAPERLVELVETWEPKVIGNGTNGS